MEGKSRWLLSIGIFKEGGSGMRQGNRPRNRAIVRRWGFYSFMKHWRCYSFVCSSPVIVNVECMSKRMGRCHWAVTVLSTVQHCAGSFLPARQPYLFAVLDFWCDEWIHMTDCTYLASHARLKQVVTQKDLARHWLGSDIVQGDNCGPFMRR